MNETEVVERERFTDGEPDFAADGKRVLVMLRCQLVMAVLRVDDARVVAR
jgi:hypothetical protein